MLIHSCIYYRLSGSIVDDFKWQEWAYELVDLQNKYPKESKEVIYYEAFKDFDGSSGYYLPLNDDYIVTRATQLLKYHKIRLDK